MIFPQSVQQTLLSWSGMLEVVVTKPLHRTRLIGRLLKAPASSSVDNDRTCKISHKSVPVQNGSLQPYMIEGMVNPTYRGPLLGSYDEFIHNLYYTAFLSGLKPRTLRTRTLHHIVEVSTPSRRGVVALKAWGSRMITHGSSPCNLTNSLTMHWSGLQPLHCCHPLNSIMITKTQRKLVKMRYWEMVVQKGSTMVKIYRFVGGNYEFIN